MRKVELEDKYRVPVYTQWSRVPFYLFTRAAMKREGVDIPRKAKPDAVKGGGNFSNTIYFLFDLRKWGKAGLFEQLQKEAIESGRR